MSRFVFLHGFAGAPQAWNRVVRALSHEPGVICPCLGGHLTAGCDATCFEEEVDRLAAQVREASSGSSHLVGYSLGGRIALGLLVRHPQLWHAATLVGAHPGLERETERTARVEADEQWAAQLEHEGLASFFTKWESLPMFATQRTLADDVVLEQRRWRREHDPRGLAWALRTLGLGRMPSWRASLRKVDIPVTVAAGEADEKFCALADWMAETLPRGRLRFVPGCGHNVILERPAEVASLLHEGVVEAR